MSAKIIVSVTSCYLCREYRPVQHLHLANPHVLFLKIIDMNKEDPFSAQVVQEAAKKSSSSRRGSNVALKAARTRKQNAEKKKSQFEQQSYCGVCSETAKNIILLLQTGYVVIPVRPGSILSVSEFQKN